MPVPVPALPAVLLAVVEADVGVAVEAVVELARVVADSVAAVVVVVEPAVVVAAIVVVKGMAVAEIFRLG